jgi:hypothetical protein
LQAQAYDNHYMGRRLAILLISGLVVSCAPARASQDSGRPRTPSQSHEIVLAHTQVGRIDRTALVITFEAIAEDSRCPTGVDCIWAGDVSVTLRLESREAAAERVTLHLNTSAREALHGDHRVTLVAVAPHPKAGEKIEAASYRVTLRVEKR